MTTDKTPPAPCDATCNGVQTTCDAPVLGEAEIARIEIRASKATPGPWKRDVWYVVAEVPQGRPGGEVIGNALPTVRDLPGYPHTQQMLNAIFIVAARADIPSLIASHRTLTAQLRAAEERERIFTKAFRQIGEKASTTIAVNSSTSVYEIDPYKTLWQIQQIADAASSQRAGDEGGTP